MERLAMALGAAVLSVGLAGCSHPQPVYYPPPPPPPAVEAPSPSAVWAQGQRDGYEAARNDVARQRPPVMERHGLFRRPPVPGEAWEEYRRAFRQGYQQFLHEGAGPPPPGY